MKRPAVTDSSIERMISILLAAGVSLAAFFVIAGGLLFLDRHAADAVDYHMFRSQPRVDRLPSEIVKSAEQLRSRSIIQFGVLILIATPIMRVAASLVGFALERDRNYVVVTAIVLAVLVYSLVSGGVAG